MPVTRQKVCVGAVVRWCGGAVVRCGGGGCKPIIVYSLVQAEQQYKDQ